MKSEKQWLRLVNLINFLRWRGEQCRALRHRDFKDGSGFPYAR